MSTEVVEMTGAVPPPETFCLPRGYRQQGRALTHDDARLEGAPEYWNPDRIAAAAKYQYHVYAWAAQLITERGLRSLLDVGCGPGIKLGELIAPVCADIEGIDQPSAIAAARACGSPGTYREVDLERPGDLRGWRTFDLIVCADVLEHLIDPAACIELMRRFSHERTLLVISTPDRERIRGRSCMESPKPEHVREWSRAEFIAYLESRGLEVIESRLMPQDRTPIEAGLAADERFVRGEAELSPHGCHAVLARFDGRR